MKKGDIVIFNKNKLSSDIKMLLYYKNTYNIDSLYIVESVDIKMMGRDDEQWIKVKGLRDSVFRSDLFIPATKEIRKRKLNELNKKVKNLKHE